MIKRLIYILIVIIFSANLTLAKTHNAALEYNSPYAYKDSNTKLLLKKANVNMLLWEKSMTDFDKDMYLEAAMRNYYLATKIDNSLLDAHLGLARVYDAMNLDRLSKEYFFNALNLNTFNAKTNYYFANFYYKRDDYLRALSYYKIAYSKGYSKNFELNYRLAVIYEKIADIELAKAFYARAMMLKPRDKNFVEQTTLKIQSLDALNYDSSQYYLFQKK